MIRHLFNWERYWYESGERPVFEDGFLSLTENNFLFFLRNQQVKYLTLDALKEVPCMILLGERGQGKSTALSEFVQHQMGDETDSAVHVLRNLSDYSSSLELQGDVFQDNDALRSWEGGQHRLYLYLDSLDEGQLRIDTITQLMQRQLKEYRHHIDRLYLRIVCRTLDWSNDFEKQLRGLWGDGAVQSFTLAPLQKANIVETVKFYGLDVERFFEEVYTKDAALLAANPLDLFLLLDDYQQNDRLPDTRRELYERCCLNRCQETNHAHKRRDHLSAEQRQVVAGRIAACSVFTNRPSIHTSEVVVREPGEASLLVTEVTGGTEIANDVPFPIDEAAVCETLETQLFHGGDPRHWADRKYETFLAAWYISHIRQMSMPQLKNLLFHPSGRLVPQLAETAAWVADYNDGIAEQIANSDPDVLMQGNLLTLNDPTRSKLVERLLQQAQQGAIRHFTNNQLQYLCHPTIASQLSTYLDDSTLLLDARRLAIHIAESCRVAEVQASLERIALELGESQRMRSSAIYTLASLGNEDNKRRLRDLALLPFTDSDNIELKEAALFVVWPDYITAHELFISLDVPETNRSVGAPVLGTSMPPFILSRMNAEHLPIALQWVVQLPKSPMQLPMALEYIAKGVIVLAWKNLEEPAVLSTFAQVVIGLVQKLELYFLSETRTHLFPHTKSVGESLPEDDTKRRLLLNALIPLVPDDHDWVRHLRYHPALYSDRDLTWLIERFTRSDEARERSLLAKMIDGCCIWSQQSEETALLFNVIEGNDELAAALGTEFVAYLQTLYEQQEEARERGQAEAIPDPGPGAQSLFYRVRKTVERIAKTVAYFGYRMVQMLPVLLSNDPDAIPTSPEERHTEPEAVDPVIIDRIESCLKKCEGGEYQEWVNVSAWMSCDKLDRPNPYYLIRTNIESLPAWNAFDATAHERLVTTAQSFVEHYDPHDLEWRDDPLNKLREPMAGYRAFRLILSIHPDRLEVISPETWQRWAEIVTFYGHYSSRFSMPVDHNDETPIATLLNLTYKFAPDEVLDTLDWIIANRSEAAVWDVLSRAKAVWDDKVAERLMTQLADLTPKGKSILLESLLRHGYEPAAAYAHSLLDSPPPDDAEAYEHIVQATCELLRYDAVASWGTVWNVIERDERFGRAIIEMLLETDFVNGLWLVKRIANDALHNLFVWLIQRYPADEDPPQQGIFSPTLRHTIADFRDGVLRELCERGDFTAIQVIAGQFPDQNFSRELESARLQYRHTSWTPLKPTEFLELMRNHDLRQITSGEQLLELLEELLVKLSRQLQGGDQAQATVGDLWAYVKNGKKHRWYPKEEKALSNYVAGFIQRNARRLIIGREAEVNTSSEDRTDISVHTFRSMPDRSREDVITAVIEVKGNWHPDVQTAMQTQLVDTYLIPNSWQHGLYLVGWFACSSWDSDNRKNRDKGKLGDDFESAQRLFSDQAQDISKQTGLDVRAFVLDARLK